MKERIKRLLPTNRFARSVTVLAGGTAAGQAILVLFTPILTRLYTPEDFGLLAVFASILGILGVIASLRYQLAIPLPESDEEAAHITGLSLLVVLGVTLIVAVAVFSFGEPIAIALNTPALARYLWLLPLGLLLSGIYQVFNYWAIRTKAFPAIARTKLTQSATMVAVQIGGHALGPIALLIGRVFGHAAGTTSLGLLAIRKHWSLFRKARPADIAWAANRYRRFPLYSSWGGAFNTAGQELPQLLFAALFSPAAAGVYLLAYRVLAMPMSLIGKAIADVFFSHAADARRNGELAHLVTNIHDKLAQIAMPPALILVLAGPDLFALVFGESWRQAGQFAQWMAPWVYLVFVTSPLSTLFSVLEKQAQGLIFQGGLLATRIGTLVVGAAYDDLMLAVALFAVGSAFWWTGFLVWIMHHSGNRIAGSLQATTNALLRGIVVVIPIVFALVMDVSQAWLLAALALSSLLMAMQYTQLARKTWRVQ